ncbi:hypothetical protein [Microbacterium sp. SS28]|uniref:hypothetical protein n=1 Tax=Microbacterium sp. SS28 TaxID=2919948 RepID=UPI002432D3EA|nr:hypothetical protein [Microbacterium sp. SS28]
MRMKWKVITGAALAVSLVIAPLAALGAAADEVPPDPTTTAVVDDSAAVEEPAAAAPAEPASAPAEEPAAAPAPEPAAEPAAAPEESVAAPEPTAEPVAAPEESAAAPAEQPEADVGQAQADPYPAPAPSPTSYPEVVTLATPVADDACGTQNDMYVLPEDTAGVTYMSDGPDIVAVIATGFVVENAPAGWVMEDDTTWRYAFNESNFTDEPCLIPVTLMPPVIVDECGMDNDSVTPPADTEGVHYDWASPDPNNLDIMATVQDGYVVEPLPEGWVDNGDGTFTYVFTYEFTDEACPPTPVTLMPPVIVDECGMDNDSVTPPADTEGVHYDWASPDPNNLDIIAMVQEGYVVETVPEGWVDNGDGTFTYVFTYEFTDVPCVVVVTLMPPQIVDECGTANDDAALPDDTEGVHYDWVDFDDPANLDVMASVQEGYVVETLPEGWVDNEDGTFTYVFTYEFTDEDCPLSPGSIGSVCVSDIPWMDYEVFLPEGFVPDSATPLSITFVNPSGPNYVVSNLALKGRILWPGASVNPPGWPGWVLNADGTYSETTGNYAWTRNGVTVIFEVNPTYETVVAYPAATSTCANPPKPAGLAVTGSDPMPWGVGGAAALALGIALVTLRRFARR